jgi:hypothetical protein
MEVSEQLYVPAALPLEEEPPVSIGHEVGWAPEPFQMQGQKEENTFLH